MLPKNHFISIFSIQTINEQSTESKVKYPCKLYMKNNLCSVLYEENDGVYKILSNIKVFRSGKIIISRKKGENFEKLIFEQNKCHNYTHFTEFGALTLEIFTHDVSCYITKNYCKIELLYSLNSSGTTLSKNKIIIIVEEEKNV